MAINITFLLYKYSFFFFVKKYLKYSNEMRAYCERPF